MRCDACGARNSDDAAWCTQCYASFQEAAPASPASDPIAPPAPDPITPPAAGPAVATGQPTDQPTGDASDPAASAPSARTSSDVTGAAAPGPAATPSGGRTDRDIREIDGQVEWRCPTCTSWVALEDPVCATCGAARVGFGDPATPSADGSDVAEQVVLGASAVLPGAGHFLTGRVGSGVTRAALFLLWAVGGLWWIVSTQDGRSPGIVLLVGAVVLWAATLVDANAITKGQSSEPFGVRGLLWTVVGVTGLLMLMVAFAAAGSLGG